MNRAMVNRLMLIATLVVVHVSGLTGCDTPQASTSKSIADAVRYEPTEEEKATADYGAYPSDYEQVVEDYLHSRVKNPESVRCEFGTQPPTKTHIGGLSLGDTFFCYRVTVMVSGKNRYGDHVDAEAFPIYLRNGLVINDLLAEVEAWTEVAIGAERLRTGSDPRRGRWSRFEIPGGLGTPTGTRP